MKSIVYEQNPFFTSDFVRGKKQSAESVQKSDEKHRITTVLGTATPQTEKFIEKDDTIALTQSSNCGH